MKDVFVIYANGSKYELEAETGLVRVDGVLVGRIQNVNKPPGNWGTAPIETEIRLQHPGNESIN